MHSPHFEIDKTKYQVIINEDMMILFQMVTNNYSTKTACALTEIRILIGYLTFFEIRGCTQNNGRLMGVIIRQKWRWRWQKWTAKCKTTLARLQKSQRLMLGPTDSSKGSH